MYKDNKNDYQDSQNDCLYIFNPSLYYEKPVFKEETTLPLNALVCAGYQYIFHWLIYKFSSTKIAPSEWLNRLIKVMIGLIISFTSKTVNLSMAAT
jgi:hypothetical protein